MRTLKLLSLMMLLTLTCVTTEASTATETAYTTQVKNKKHAKKEPHNKVTSHKKITTNRPSGVVVHYNHKPYLYSHGYYYCQQNGRYVKVRPSIGMIVPSLPSGYTTVHRSHGKTNYAFGGVIYEKVFSNGTTKFKIVGFM